MLIYIGNTHKEGHTSQRYAKVSRWNL